MSDATRDDRPRCGTCAYYDPKNSDGDPGTCRRHAPSSRVFAMVLSDGEQYPVWPSVLCDEWCGEHQLMPDYIRRHFPCP